MPSARELKLIPETQISGKNNAITDVPGILVGHQTIRRGDLNTGVTAILPHSGNLFANKVPAATNILNGFGKSVGLMQIEELGCIESPIVLTNTFSVGTGFNAVLRRAIAENPAIGRETSTFSPVVCECNDGPLSDIQSMAVTEDDVTAAIENATGGVIEQGGVGAGTGTMCFGYKGGIGTASRKILIDGEDCHMGIMVYSNFGSADNLILPCGFSADINRKKEEDKGSIIIIMATDIPMDNRQLRRVSKRCGAGLARLGSNWGHGSGDIVVAFSTASRIHHDEKRDFIPASIYNESRINTLFDAAAECTMEAILNSMLMAKEVVGFRGKHARSLADCIRRG